MSKTKKNHQDGGGDSRHIIRSPLIPRLQVRLDREGEFADAEGSVIEIRTPTGMVVGLSYDGFIDGLLVMLSHSSGGDFGTDIQVHPRASNTLVLTGMSIHELKKPRKEES